MRPDSTAEHIARPADFGAFETRGSDADHGELHAVELDRLPHASSVAGAAPLPIGVAQHDYGVAARNAILFREEEAPDTGREPENREVVRGNDVPIQRFGALAVEQADSGVEVTRQRRKHRVAITQVEVIRESDRILHRLAFRGGTDGDELVRFAHTARRAVEQRPNQCIDRRFGTDAERERKDCYRRKGRAARQGSEGLPQVLEQHPDPFLQASRAASAPVGGGLVPGHRPCRHINVPDDRRVRRRTRFARSEGFATLAVCSRVTACYPSSAPAMTVEPFASS
jgi:hypothetical protein